MAAQQTSDDISYVTALVREADRPRYYATLFAPAAARADLFAIHGFAAEIARVPDQVSDPMLGEIRLRWWQQALADTLAGGAGGAPALRAVAGAIARHKLPLAPFEALIEARSADLYSDPPATLADVEGRMGETESVLFQMAAIMLGASGPETADAAGHAGIAYGVARRLGTFASDRARGRTIVPADVLARRGLTPADLFATQTRSKFLPAIKAMTELASRHLANAQNAVARLAPPLQCAFLPLATVAPLLERIGRMGGNTTLRNVQMSDFEALLRTTYARVAGLGGRSG